MFDNSTTLPCECDRTSSSSLWQQGGYAGKNVPQNYNYFYKKEIIHKIIEK